MTSSYVRKDPFPYSQSNSCVTWDQFILFPLSLPNLFKKKKIPLFVSAVKKMKSANVTMSTLVVLLAIMATELLGHPTPDESDRHHHHHRHQHTDPNIGRASRLLYSPRSRSLNNNNVPDMHTALRRWWLISSSTSFSPNVLLWRRIYCLLNWRLTLYTSLRLRESQQMATSERQSNSAAIIQNEPQPNDVEASHTNRNEEDESSLKGNDDGYL